MRSFAIAQVTARLDRVRLEIDRTRQSPDEEAVHDLRVSIRRLVQALRLFGDILGGEQVVSLRDLLRPILRLAGEVRNRDIAMILAREAGLGPRTLIQRTLLSERAQKLEELLARLGAPGSIELSPRWTIGDSRRWDLNLSPAENARRRLPLMAARFLKRGRKAIRPEATWADLHQFRLRGKRFRYSLEVFSPLYGKGLAARIASVRKLQQVLGDINDCETMLAMAVVWRNRPLVAWLDQRRAALRRRFEEVWQADFGGPHGERKWLAYLERYAR